MTSSGDPTPERIVGLLADSNRRRVLAALTLAAAPLDSAAVAFGAGITLRDTVDALDRLSGVGLVDGGPDAWQVDGDVFSRVARMYAPARPPSAFADEPADAARVLDTVFRDGKLTKLPTKRARRLIVLDHLAQRFEIGQRYSEAEVNDVLTEAHDDYAMLRRWLVDEQFLDRSDGRYWRCGGSV